ncbi:MAG: hypothetical protein LBE82_13710 [Chitinophagaceae bacterium]|jgi:hypothetical protein|nr:hypothetical protein [Chitinophagaceae bacterium]
MILGTVFLSPEHSRRLVCNVGICALAYQQQISKPQVVVGVLHNTNNGGKSEWKCGSEMNLR